MKSLYRFTLALSVCLLLLVPAVSLAQTTGTVEGSVTDQSNSPLPGVTVELTSPNLQGTRTAVTAADGRYRFPSIPPGAYTVTAELSGFGKVQRKATVALDATATVNLSLSLSTSAEITVTGEAPMVDSTSTTQGSNYSAKVIDKLPVGRNYADIVFTQPGVQADFGETQGRSLAISIYGSTSSENLFLIDGVNTTNVIKGFQGKDINNEFIQEVEVKTGGYQAEYGRNTGGVVNVITKSGGNEFHGGVFGYYNDTGMRADWDVPVTPDFSEQGTAENTLAGPNSFINKDVRQEWGADLGGFILKDKVWFFGAYDRVQINQTLTPLGGPRANEDFPAFVLPEQVLGQADAEPAPGHLDRRQRLRGRADAKRRPDGPRRFLAVHVQRPARHGRTGLRRAAEPALRLVRHLHVPVRAALRPLRHQALRPGRSGDPRLHDRPLRDRHQLHDGRRLRQRVRAHGQQRVQPPALLGVVHGLCRQPRDQDRRRLPGRHDHRFDVLHRRPAPSRPALPSDRHEHLRPLPGALLHQRGRPDAAGLLPARPAGRRHLRQLPDHPGLALRRSDQALQRLHPGPVAHHPDPDHEPRRPLRLGELLRLLARTRRSASFRRSSSTTSGRRASASCGISSATARRSCTLRPAGSTSRFRPT